MENKSLPVLWEQDDELDGITELDIERRIRQLKAQLPQAQEHVQSDLSIVADDGKRIELARRIAHAIDAAGSDTPANLKTQADALVRKETEREEEDLQKTLDESEHVKWLSDEIRYGEAWINACNHVRALPRNALQHLTDALDNLTMMAGQLALPAGVVILDMPDSVQECDVHLLQQRTVETGKRIVQETQELTVKLLVAPHRAEDKQSVDEKKSNVVLRTVFNVAKFLYYAFSLARTVGGAALLQGFHNFHHILEKFMALLPATMRLAV